MKPLKTVILKKKCKDFRLLFRGKHQCLKKALRQYEVILVVLKTAHLQIWNIKSSKLKISNRTMHFLQFSIKAHIFGKEAQCWRFT